ncbi:VWA domain-containing protein [Candidatus Sumerlaeota bacterium]|nr:VWA domain-containing protein [Candidatus Sumerlaeota bacterium]
MNNYILLLLIPLLILTLWPGLRLSGMSKGRRNTALALRCLVFTLIVFSLAEAQWQRKSDQLTTVFVFDDSDSIPPEKKKEAYEFIQQAVENKPKKDRVGLVIFATDASIEYSPRERLENIDQRSIVRRNQTNIAGGLQLALASMGQETRKRIVLISDGNETMNYADVIAREVKSNGGAVDVVPVTYHHRSDIVVDKVLTPGRVKLNEPFNLSVFVRSLIDTKAKITVYRDNQKILTDYEVQLNGGQKNVFVLPMRIPDDEDVTAFHNFEVLVEPVEDAAPDLVKENNHGNSFTWTTGRPRVLLVEGDPLAEEHLEAALLSEDILIDRKLTTEIPQAYEELLGYESIIFSNVPAGTLSRTQMTWIENAVHELGIGFIMIGGENSFGAGGYQDTPIEKALPVSMEIKQKKVIPKGALCVILHTCEFPDGNKWARDITRAALDVLSSKDLMGVLDYEYSRGEDWVFPMSEVGDKQRMHKLISQANPGDMPDFDPTLKMAYKGLLNTNASVKHIIIISDGDCGRPTQSLVQSIVAAKITISTICVFPHSGADTSVMEDLAEWGHGRYYKPNSPKLLPKIFVKEAASIRRTLIVEETFTPSYVEHSDLLGEGFDTFPPLHGYVATEVKPTADQPLVSHEKDPILACWRYGVGKTVAFTSDARNRWAADWIGWDQFKKFWAQTVRWSMRSIETGDYQLTTTVEGGKGKVVIDAIKPDVDEDFVATVIPPDLRPIDVTVRQTAAGRYEGEFEADQVGTYLVKMNPKGSRQVLTGGFSMSYSPEFQDWKSNEPLLQSIAEISGGRVLKTEGSLADAAGAVFDKASLPPARRNEPLWPLTMLLALMLVPADIFVRRVLVDWAMIKSGAAVVRDYIAGIFLSRRGRQEETVESLLDVKQKLRTREDQFRQRAAEHEADESAETAREEGPGKAKADRLAKLDAIKTDSSILQKKEQPKPASLKPGDAPKEEGKSGDTAKEGSELNRLLEAKKRALKRRKR